LHDVLQAAIHRVVSADPAAVPLLRRFPGGVYLLDSSTLTLPDALAEVWAGCGGTTAQDGLAAVKIQVRYDVLHGTLAGPFLSPGRASDHQGALAPTPPPKGSLRLADLGFFSLDTLRDLSAQEVYWLTRVQPGTKLYDATGAALPLAAFLEKQTGRSVDISVFLGVKQRVPGRLVAVRVPPAVAEKRRARLRKKARKKGRKHVAPEQLALAAWNVYVTNVPGTLLSVGEVLVLARCRWQIELLFKLWKSEGHIDESRSGKPWRILCEVYAKLLGMVVQHWILLVSCWSQVARSLVKASRSVRKQAAMLVAVLPNGQLVCVVLELIRKALQAGCTINKRRKEPATYQLLLAPPEVEEAGQT
jgi:hypothetical protein